MIFFVKGYVNSVYTLTCIPVNGLLDVNTKLELKVVDDDIQPKKPIKRSLCKILMGLKVNTVHLWKIVMMVEQCGFEGYNPNGKGGVRNFETTILCAGNLVGHLHFYLLKRGVEEESVKDFLVASFSSDTVVITEESCEDKYGRVISRSQRHMYQEVERIERCAWIGASPELLKAEKKLTQKVENWDSVIDPTSMAAFNFNHNIKKRAEERANDDGSAITSVMPEGSVESTVFEEPDDEKTEGGYTHNKDGKGNNKKAQE